MEDIKEYKVGDKFQFGRVKLRVEEVSETSCVGCLFRRYPGNVCGAITDFTGSCAMNNRVDGNNVIFVKVEDDEKEQME